MHSNEKMTIPRLAEQDGVIAAFLYRDMHRVDYVDAMDWCQIVDNAIAVLGRSACDDLAVQIGDAQTVRVHAAGNLAVAVVMPHAHPRGKSINRSMRKVIHNYKAARSGEAVSS